MAADVSVYLVAFLAFAAIAGLGLALTSGESAAAKKRAKAIATGRSGQLKSSRGTDESVRRRAQTQEMLEMLRREDKERKRNSPMRDIKSKLAHAGLDLSPAAFWILSVVSGAGCGFIVYASGADGLVISGIAFKSRPLLVGAAFFAGMIGLPRVILGMMIGARHAKMVNQFADALDIIVRGVKSGLSLNECVRVIAKESPEPLRSEFVILADNLSMGASLERSLGSLYKRMPLHEVNFFSIVLMIQAKAGGNLAEALGNLSSVIRSRKLMGEKVKALSSEAKASAMIIGSLPFVVGLMVYVTTPAYIMELFTTETGHVVLASATALMITGITVMRNMINFDM